MHHHVSTVSPYTLSVWKDALADIKYNLSSYHIRDRLVSLQIISCDREYSTYCQQLGNPDSSQEFSMQLTGHFQTGF